MNMNFIFESDTVLPSLFYYFNLSLIWFCYSCFKAALCFAALICVVLLCRYYFILILLFCKAQI